MTTKCRLCRLSTFLCVQHQKEFDEAQVAFRDSLSRLVEEDQELLAEIDEHDIPCTPWESKFIASCMGQERRLLSEKQRAKAREILARLECAS